MAAKSDPANEHLQARTWHPLEYGHVFLWLIKDMCWAQGWVLPGVIMIFPTLAVAYILTWIQQHNTPTLVHNISISCWISANSLWMWAEFFGQEEKLKPIASAGFALGITILLLYYASSWVKKKKPASAGFD